MGGSERASAHHVPDWHVARLVSLRTDAGRATDMVSMTSPEVFTILSTSFCSTVRLAHASRRRDVPPITPFMGWHTKKQGHVHDRKERCETRRPKGRQEKKKNSPPPPMPPLSQMPVCERTVRISCDMLVRKELFALFASVASLMASCSWRVRCCTLSSSVWLVSACCA